MTLNDKKSCFRETELSIKKATTYHKERCFPHLSTYSNMRERQFQKVAVNLTVRSKEGKPFQRIKES
ncbi:hypothetical protein COK98_02860 [Bacillus cereus]|uniref:Uncharacterized protein n=1 Tax=Bacillus cereus TaxID=1396 RepID=A0A9X7BG70_BACCE|nr:hypothetical protein CON26_20835 [Bacillus cereus]PFV11228.1 hypothetical protein COK98_02860 [Bacillus cereus]